MTMSELRRAQRDCRDRTNRCRVAHANV